ncbi:MAG: hypothetical protein JRE36_17645 [Deltaproteobacteria bacterium]|nr:hypothetical protein [Deltaproteobacteria bacterium]
MAALFSLVGLLFFFAIGAFSIYLVIDFIEYLKQYHSQRWAQLSFARLFGISQQDLFFYQIHPLKFIPYLFKKTDPAVLLRDFSTVCNLLFDFLYRRLVKDLKNRLISF